MSEVTANSQTGRRSRQEAAKTRERILEEALRAFAELGFAAASLRKIADAAGVTQQLITHHFGSKLSLWKAAADHLFAEIGAEIGDRLGDLENAADDDPFRDTLREFLRLTARHPEFVRFMMHEGATLGPRARWLVEQHVRPLMEASCSGIEAAQSRGMMVKGDVVHLAYLLIGSTLIFTQTVEYELLTGRDSRSPRVVEEHIDLVLRVMIPEVSGSK